MFDIYIYYEDGQSNRFVNVTKVLNSNNEEINLEKESIPIDLEKVTFFSENISSCVNLKKMNTLQVIVKKILDEDLPIPF